MVERKIIKAQVGDNSQKQFLKNWYSKRKIQDDYLQEALELDKPNILKRLNNFTNYNYIDNLSSGNSGENNITGQFNPNANKVFIKKGINNLSDVKLHELNHYATYNKQGDYITTGHQDIVNNEIKSKQEREGIYKNDYFQDPREIHSRIMVLRKDAGFKPDVPVTQKDLDGYLKKKEVLDKSGKRLYYNLPENVNDIFQNAKSNKSVLNMLNYMAVNDNNKLDNKMQNGGMIKRADGSYSKRGLWDSIRANKGSGKSPTKEMLAQERKINNKQVGGDNELMELFNQFANSVDDDDFQSGEDVYNEYNKLNTIQQKQFLSSIQEQGTSSMQTGGSKYITSDLKDYNKRNKSYNDSLSLYKNGLNLQNQQFKQHKIQTDRFEGSKVTNWKGKEALNSLMKQYKKDKIKPTSVGIYTMNSDAPDNPGYPVYKKPNQKVLYQKPIEQVIQQQEVPQEVLQQIKTSPVLPMKNMVTPLLKYDRGDPRSKNTVDYKITNDGKQWTPEEYDNYIDEQKAKTSNYNKSLREMQTGGIPTNRNGYYELDPEENPIARIPSNSLSMRSIPYDIQAIGGTTGTDYGYMKPEGEYQFDDEEFMYEIPKAQTGDGNKLSSLEKKLNNPEVKEMLKLQTNQNRGYLNNQRLVELEAKHLPDLKRAEKQFNRIERNRPPFSTERPKVNVNIESQKYAEQQMFKDKFGNSREAYLNSLEKPVSRQTISNQESANEIRNKNQADNLNKEYKSIKRLDQSKQKTIDEIRANNRNNNLNQEFNPISRTQQSNQGTIDDLRFKNQQLAKSETLSDVEQAFKKISDNRVSKRVFTRGNQTPTNTGYLSSLKGAIDNLPSLKNVTNKLSGVAGVLGTLGLFSEAGVFQNKKERERDKNAIIDSYYNGDLDETSSEEVKRYLYSQKEPTKINVNTPKGGRFNKDFSLTGDMDMVQSRQANVPFLRSNQTVSNTQSVPNTQLDEVLDTAPRLRQNTGRNTTSTSKPRYNPAPIRSNQSASVDNGRQFISKFNKEYSPAELDAQYNDSLANRPPETTPVENVPSGFVDPAVNRGATSNNGYIGSRPITIGYDNDAEARAIQYRKLKNSSVLAPYRGGMTLESPSLYQESTTPYLDNIREQRNAMLQQVNPNSSTGQALLANMYGQGLNQENQVIGEVARNNAQNTTQYLNQRADINNKQQQFDYNNDNRYYGDVAQLQSNQDEEDINYMNSIANMQGKRLQAKNSLFNTAIMTGLPDEALHIGDEGVTFDVSKIPKGFYDGKSNNKTQPTIPSQQKEKSIMIGGVPHAIEYDDNGKITNYRKIPVVKAQYGTMNKYNFKKQKNQ